MSVFEASLIQLENNMVWLTARIWTTAQYQMPNGTTATPGNELGIFQSLGQHYHQDDLDKYFRFLAPYALISQTAMGLIYSALLSDTSPKAHIQNCVPSTVL